jgi:ATP-dependent Clp protease protease subunit
MSSKNSEDCNSVSFAYNNVKREIYVTGEITDDLYQNVIAAFRELDDKKGKITIILNSAGGNVNTALAMYDLFRLAKNKTTCYCMGNCMSAAMVILCGCDECYATENCRFMVHPVSLNDTGGPLTFLQATVGEVAHSNEIAITLLAKHSGLTRKEVVNLCKDTTYMSAEQAVGYGWFDGILKPNRRK